MADYRLVKPYAVLPLELVRPIDYYAGVGSRDTPIDICEIMVGLGQLYGRNRWGLRSGGARRADSAFEKGCDLVGGRKQIFRSRDAYINTTEALELAARHHPAWHKCSPDARLLHARNGYQVLGPTLDNPSKFVLCWTCDGGPTGGTGQAIRIANANNIPVYNLFHREILDRAVAALIAAGLL